MSIRVEVSLPVTPAPHLLSFPNGVPFANEDGGAADPLLTVYRKGSGRKQKGGVVFASSAVTYKGCDFAERTSEVRADACKYAVGVYDGDLDLLTVTPAPHAFIMRPDFSGMAKHPKTPVRLSSMTAQERRESRTEEFGSSKRKRLVKAGQSNSILSQNISGASALASAVSLHYESMEVSRDEVMGDLQDGGDAALEKQRRENLPPYNAHATEAEEIYPFEQMVPADVLAAIEQHYDSLAEEGRGEEEAEQSSRALRAWLQRLREQQAPDFALDVLSERLRSVDKAAGKDKRLKSANRPAAVRRLVVKALLLCWAVKYCCMMKGGCELKESQLKKNPLRKAELKAALDAPHEAVKYLLSERFGFYCMRTGAVQASKEGMNKLVLFVLVLSLSMCKFKVGLEELGMAMKVPQNGLAVYAREAGCKISKEGSKLTASLMAPLVFPKRKRARS